MANLSERSAAQQFNRDEAKVRDYITKLFRNVPVLDTGARGATTTSVQRENSFRPGSI